MLLLKWCKNLINSRIYIYILIHIHTYIYIYTLNLGEPPVGRCPLFVSSVPVSMSVEYRSLFIDLALGTPREFVIN